ncbi:uncharacterized protein BX664DRAFT_294128 [Halteromyces radiatus]|uniref:uncharacterized protein n=1 Tax=Halteromyces radiatus TaxID=101107 RepID=UPI00221EE16F|nr:uncharacterized protein BX664DRAFT_294128 [Halteromyces radiatus]KAI8092809.1 hypothetical protein BX664DRAFT_294128 [Halteromyces radiatus]
MMITDITNVKSNIQQKSKYPGSYSNKKPLRLVLDEPVLFVEDKPAMVRGEVIVNFSNDTTIQGPIELVFEAIQTFYPWSEIMVNRAIGSPIESKLQVIELSLLPPNSQGIMPAGVHRFPFEFPIPPTLPPTLSITNRLAIYYRLTATLRKSSEATSLMDWAMRSIGKKKLVDVSHLRLVRAIEGTRSISQLDSSPLGSSSVNENSNNNNTNQVVPYTDLWTQYNNRLSLDEQHDQLIHSLGGRTTDNYTRPLDSLIKEHGVRYKLSVDRTAIALGTSVGIEVVLQPTQKMTKVRSIYLSIEEKRKYKMNIPGRHSFSDSPAESRHHSEVGKMVLKWAYGYPVPSDDEPYPDYYDEDHLIANSVTSILSSSSSSSRSSVSSMSSTEQRKSTLLGKNDVATSSISAISAMKASSSTSETQTTTDLTSSPKGGLLNLKLLDHPIELGEYFEGRFVLPVPSCGGLLHPSMDHDSIKIQHWLRMVVVLEQEGKMFEVALETPMHMLDCRLVADDGRQTILPPPPSYNTDDDNRSIPSTVFWEQRQPITTLAQWGTCRRPCPCQIKNYNQQKSRLLAAVNNKAKSSVSSKQNNNIRTSQEVQEQPIAGCQPEWGPPPLYSE